MAPRADRLIRATTTASVVLLALIAAVVSYRHMHHLARLHGESECTAALIPLSVDGMIVASSMAILSANRTRGREGRLAWALLIVGSLASLAANVAVAEPTAAGRIIAAWPSFALVGAYEMLMNQMRGNRPSAAPADRDVSVSEPAPEIPTSIDMRGERLQQRAWRWAQEHRRLDGKLPSGVEIGRQFNRSSRWGRLVKRNGGVGLSEVDCDEEMPSRSGVQSDHA
ncbi:DUF2637 domain-containing protein [Actinomadura rupiterrae]|uniref:DUF2637 domain-containing protein n=1 Tax=Actinomadura rupiterrae TaxID=559627 RepID=UPI0020A23489|nr:DUF2637 domain-containing protein [Actinomadura rupiterrae]